MRGAIKKDITPRFGMIQDSFICFSLHNDGVSTSNINILAQGGCGKDRTVF